MAKTLKTRIKNRYDSLTNWSKTGVELLPGEIALVSVKTQQLDEKTGNVVDVPAVLMKVGGYKKDANGEDTTEIASFSELPWVSALAADVYDWAKEQYAKDIDVAVTTGSGTGAKTETKTLGAWLKATLEADAANAAASSANTAAIATLNKGDNDTGSVANTAKAKVTAAINALNLTNAQATGEGTFVKTVTQTNGQIAVVKAKIAANDLPEITTSMIKPGDTAFTTLEAKLDDMDSKIANFKSGISHDYNSTTGNYVKNVAYDATTGKITVTKGGIGSGDVSEAAIASNAVTTAKIKDANVTEAKLATDAVTTAKIKDGNVTDEKIGTVSASKVIYTPGTDPVTLPEKIAEVEGLIADINTAIGGGVHFRGEVTAPAKLDENLTTRSVTINGKSYAANNGDVVIQGSKEYIWVAATETTGTWKELGDLSRVGTVEELLSVLPESARTANQYVTHIAKENGKLVAKKARPLAAEIQYASGSTDTVYSKIEANAADIADKADKGHEHTKYENQHAFTHIKTSDGTVSADTATDTVEFVGSNITITGKDAANDQITFSVADGSTSVKGIVKLSDANTGDVVPADSTTAATTKAVKEAYAKGAQGIADASAVNTDLHTNYARLAAVSGKTGTYTMHLGTDTEEIIFDCGGAL
jgi:hypothetical protein